MSHYSVLVVEDDSDLREALCDTLALGGFQVTSSEDAAQALQVLRKQRVDVVVTDVQMPGMDGHALQVNIKTLCPETPVLLMTAYASVERAIEAIRSGAADYLVKPFEAEVLIARIHAVLPRMNATDEDYIAEDPSSRALFAVATRVAESEATVLLAGESGTGKEVLFRYIHTHSRRASGPAVAINCAAIPENMLEAMLFGHEKGAFTGAYKACVGKFEQAQGGTLLLDEISEMSLPLQAKLLRVLQEREVERLGSTTSIQLDVRVVATTNRYLQDEVAAGRFREDLYYRLSVFPIQVPTLRERPLDVIPLARFLLGRAASRGGIACPALSDEAAARLMAHTWPGNVRELDNVMQRALILQSGGRIQAADIHIAPVGSRPAEPRSVMPSLPAATVSLPVDSSSEEEAEETLDDGLRQHEQQIILQALRDGSMSRARIAEKLGISQRTLRYKLARMKDQGVELPR